MKRFIFSLLCLLVLVLPHTAFADDGTYIVTLKDRVSLYGLCPDNERDYVVLSSEELAEYLEAGIVENYEPNYKVELLGDTWNLDAVNCNFAWELGCFGNEVRIGIIDSGLYPAAELQDNIIAGKNYLTGTTDTADNVGHGTFVAGIIASESRGISYKSKIVPLKCFEKDTDTYVDDILGAIYDAIDVYDCDVINMSLGVPADASTLETAITYAVDNGAIVVSAVGNDGETTVYYPAGYDNVVGVGSVDEASVVSWFSQYNESVFVTAPGENVISLGTGSGLYSIGDGTSFAAPHVSALAAIAKCIDKDIDTTRFKEILRVSSQDLGEAGYDVYYGYGLVNFESFIKEMLKSTPVFMSPINSENEKVYSVIYNNSENNKTFSAICTLYNGNALKNCFVDTIELLPNEKYRFETSSSDGYVKHMLWNNLSSLEPVINYRDINN